MSGKLRHHLAGVLQPVALTTEMQTAIICHRYHYQFRYFLRLCFSRFSNLYHPYFANSLINLKTWHKVTYYSPYFIRIDYFCNIF